MWAVTNRTPYKAAGAWGRDQSGVHEWIVAVKATFDIRPDGGVAVSEQQMEPLLLPEYNGEDGRSSLRYDADLVAPKPTTDVVINGTAYAPHGRPTKSFPIAMRVGPVQKQITVTGNRTWERGVLGMSASQAEAVTEVPLLYECAYGGYDQRDPNPANHRLDTRNPVGCGLVAEVGQAVPNFEYPSGKLEKAGPAGFGALDSFWSPRRELCGTYDDAWQKSRYPLLPVDWNPRSLLCSPIDQQPSAHVQGGEPVALVNLTREGLLSFALPHRQFKFRTMFNTVGARTREHEARLATVVIEPDHRRLILVWVTALTCRSEPDYLEETIVEEAR